MKLTFLGTRGGIVASKRGHRMHTATLFEGGGARVLVDCGRTWLGELARLSPDAIIITHAHPDHADGLARGAPCSVHASTESWRHLGKFPIPASLRRVLPPRRPTRIGSLAFEAFPVIHSVIAPAVGLRIGGASATVFYVPDVLRIIDRGDALRGIDAYIGDGASIARSIVRSSRETGESIGHASIAAQLDWCRDEGVARMIVTHCGTQIVAHDERRTAARLRAMASERGLTIEIARDGRELRIGR